jgi:hypothetical protein
MSIAQEYFEESVRLEQPVLPVIQPKMAEYYQTFHTRVPPLMDVSIHLFLRVISFTDKFSSSYRTVSPSLVTLGSSGR